jgi:hypothetical protein
VAALIEIACDAHKRRDHNLPIGEVHSNATILQIPQGLELFERHAISSSRIQLIGYPGSTFPKSRIFGKYGPVVSETPFCMK